MNESWLTNHNDRVELFAHRSLRRKQWRWRVRASNGQIVEHGESYVRRIDAVTAAERHHPRVEP